jgi:hypothetical protein
MLGKIRRQLNNATVPLRVTTMKPFRLIQQAI